MGLRRVVLWGLVHRDERVFVDIDQVDVHSCCGNEGMRIEDNSIGCVHRVCKSHIADLYIRGEVASVKTIPSFWFSGAL